MAVKSVWVCSLLLSVVVSKHSWQLFTKVGLQAVVQMEDVLVAINNEVVCGNQGPAGNERRRWFSATEDVLVTVNNEVVMRP